MVIASRSQPPTDLAQEGIANARLIAAAPDLLAVCKAILATGSQWALTVFGPGEGEEAFRIHWTRFKDGFHSWKISDPAADRFSETQVLDMIEAANCCLDDPSQQEALENMANALMQENYSKAFLVR